MFLLNRDGVLGPPAAGIAWVCVAPDAMKPNARSKVFHIYPQTRMLKKEISSGASRQVNLARSTASTAHAAMQLVLATSSIKR
jgi:hypothetical protein